MSCELYRPDPSSLNLEIVASLGKTKEIQLRSKAFEHSEAGGSNIKVIYRYML